MRQSARLACTIAVIWARSDLGAPPNRPTLTWRPSSGLGVAQRPSQLSAAGLGRAQRPSPMLAAALGLRPSPMSAAAMGHAARAAMPLHRRIAWVHIPKCGTSFGTTLVHLANASLPDDFEVRVIRPPNPFPAIYIR